MSLPKSVSCYILFCLFVFLYVWKMIFSIYGAVWNGKYRIFQSIHFNMKRESFQQLLVSVPSLEHGLSLYACAVWSLVFACPRTSVCTCVDLSCESSTT